MARKTNQIVQKAPTPDWYLAEWMDTLQVSQAKLAKECDWSRGTMHGIYHGRTAYYRELVNLLASKLSIEPYELLMPPEKAMAIRQMQASAETIVTLAHEAEERTTNDKVVRLSDRTGTDG